MRYIRSVLGAGSIVMLLVLVLPVDRHPVGADLVEDITHGIRSTGKLLGIDTIADVANLVAKGLSKPGGILAGKPQEETPVQQNASTMLMMMWRLLGLDGSQLGAMLVNGLVFLAHVIGSNLGAFRNPGLDRTEDATQPSAAPQSSDSLLNWVLQNPSSRFRSLLEQVQSRNLTDHLDDELYYLEQAPAEDSICIRLLLCKIKPFIWKMQDVVRRRVNGGKRNDRSDSPLPNGDVMEVLYRNLPTLDEFHAKSKACEQQYPRCDRALGPQ